MKPWFVVRVVIGLLLLTAAGLKLHGYVVDSATQESFLSTARLQFVVIEAETVLGLWLLSGMAARAAWLATLGFFGLLAAASFYMGWQGQASCGCFGTLHVNPWVTFALDVAICVSLAMWRPPMEAASGPSRRRQGVEIAVTSAVLALLIGSGFYVTAYDPVDALAGIRGDKVTLWPNPVFAGKGSAGEALVFSVKVRNHTSKPVRLIGGTHDCSCSIASELPMEIPAGTSRQLRMRLRLRGTSGIVHRRFEIYTDASGQFRVIGSVNARVTTPRKEYRGAQPAGQ